MKAEVEKQEVLFRLENVSKIFSDKTSVVKAIDDVSFDIYKGEIFGMIGMSGAGKSTLVRTLNRLESVTSGTIFFDGEDLASLSSKKLRQSRVSIGMVFQDFHLLMQKKVLANVILPLKIAKKQSKKKQSKEEMRNRAKEMLAVVGIPEKGNAYPSQLSGGQKQRVAIARAISANPKVLLCDEATSALDPKTTEEILQLLKDINAKTGITIIIITHEMSVVEKICDRVAIMSEGKLAEIGNVQEVFTSPQSAAAKQLVYPQEKKPATFDRTDKRCVRVVFDGISAKEPILADVMEETGEKINILFADTKSVGGVAFGEMMIELPKDREGARRVLDCLRQKKVLAEEIFAGGGVQ